jgi:hypothetical protein
LRAHCADAETARQATDERYYQGRVISVEPAKAKPNKIDDGPTDAAGYKAQKAKQVLGTPNPNPKNSRL